MDHAGNLTSTICSTQILYFQWDEDLSISINVFLGIEVGTVAGIFIVCPSKEILLAVRRQALILTDIIVFVSVLVFDVDWLVLFDVLFDVPVD